MIDTQHIATENTAREKLILGIFGILYLVGIVGFALPLHPEFPRLTPLNLGLSLLAAMAFHRPFGFKFVFFILFAGIFGWVIEAVGVSTGKIFGTYHYDWALGYKLFETPLSMAINWALTVYCCGIAVNMLLPDAKWWIRTVVAAALMVSLDVLIEPIAMRYGFWSWANDEVPLQNFVGWFVVSLPIQAIFSLFFRGIKNKVAFGLLIMQFLFFFILRYFV